MLSDARAVLLLAAPGFPQDDLAASLAGVKTRLEVLHGALWTKRIGELYIVGISGSTEEVAIEEAVFAAIDLKRSVVVHHLFRDPGVPAPVLRVAISLPSELQFTSAAALADECYKFMLQTTVRDCFWASSSIAISPKAVERCNRFNAFIGKTTRFWQSLRFAAAMRNESLFDFLHQLAKGDHSFYPFLRKNRDRLFETLEYLRASGRWDDLLSIREYLHRFFELQGRYEDGAAAGRHFAEAARELGDLRGELWITLKDIEWLGLQCSASPFEFRGRALALAERFHAHGSDEGEWYCYRYLASSCIHHNELEAAKEFLNRARTVEPRLPPQIGNRLKARRLNVEGQLALRQADRICNKGASFGDVVERVDQALARFREAYGLYQEHEGGLDTSGIQEKLATLEIAMGQAHLKKRAYGEASEVLVKGRNRAIQHSWIEGVARADFFLGCLIMEWENDQEGARLRWRQALEGFKEIGQTQWIRRTEEMLVREPTLPYSSF